LQIISHSNKKIRLYRPKNICRETKNKYVVAAAPGNTVLFSLSTQNDYIARIMIIFIYSADARFFF
jgi:hypothetical protein